MATRSNLIAKIGEDWQVVYVHYDGYGHLPTLEENYNSQEKVEELFSYGDISVLDAKIHGSENHDFMNRDEGVCVFYRRDRGDENCEAKIFTSLSSALLDSFGKESWIEYAYIWDGEKWEMRKR